MDLLKSALILVLLSFTTATRKPRKELFIPSTIEKLDCVNDPVQCVDPICKLVDLGDYKYSLSVGCQFTKTCPTLMVRARNPKMFDNKFNICQSLDITNNPLLKTFVPQVIDQLKGMFRSCPYEGEFYFKNFTIDGGMIRSFRRIAYTNEYSFMCGKLMPFLKLTIAGH